MKEIMTRGRKQEARVKRACFLFLSSLRREEEIKLKERGNILRKEKNERRGGQGRKKRKRREDTRRTEEKTQKVRRGRTSKASKGVQRREEVTLEERKERTRGKKIYSK